MARKKKVEEPVVQSGESSPWPESLLEEKTPSAPIAPDPAPPAEEKAPTPAAGSGALSRGARLNAARAKRKGG